MTTMKKATKKGRTKSGKGRPPKEDDSPIKVGGGGGRRRKGQDPIAVIWCDFDHSKYPDPEPQRKKRKTFKNLNWQMKTLGFDFRGLKVDLTPVLPADGDCTISISRPGPDNDIDIGGKALGISFHDGTYELASGSMTKHQAGNSDLTKVKIEAGGLLIKDEFKPDEVWEISANWKLPGRRSSSSRRSKR